MDYNTNVSATQNNGITIVDPNPRDNKIIPSENLFIYVSLRIRPKNRSVLQVTDQGTSLDSTEGVVINFIGTQTDSNGNEYLTTNWTNTGGNINGYVTGDKNKETFGIKNISISYGADLLPRVNITFLDVKGATLFDGFEMTDKSGNKSNTSNYSSFFSLPYPIFELTIKGYYGKAVTYCLNMTKWNSNFSEGNFEIKAEFIGFNTSFLSDIIMDHVRAVIDTEEGYNELVKVYNVNSKDEVPITINQLLNTIGNIDKFVADIKGDDKQRGTNEGYNALIQLNTALSRLGLIRNKIGNTYVGTSVENNPNFYSLEGTYLNGTGLTPRGNIFAFRDIQVVDKNAFEFYSAFTESLNADIVFYDQNLPQVENFYSEFNLSTKFNTTDIVPKIMPNSTNKLGLSIPGINKLLLGDIKGRSKDEGYSVKQSEDNNFPYTYTAYTNTLLDDSQVQFFDYYSLRSVVDDLYNRLTEKRKVFADTISKQINEQINKKIGFNPSIGNIFEILCNNVEAYVKVIYNVAINAENKNNERVKLLNGKETDTDSKRVYPWPMLYDSDGYEKYIGADTNIADNEQYFPEVTFIEKLAASVVKETSKNNPSILNQTSRPFPINLGDFNNYILPYDVEIFTNTKKNQFRSDLVRRAIITYDYSNFKNNMNDIAKLEASALYDSLINQIDRNAISTFLETQSDSIIPTAVKELSLSKVGANYITYSGLTFNTIYGDVNPSVSSTTLFFDSYINPESATFKVLDQLTIPLSKSVKSSLGGKDITQVFKSNKKTVDFNTRYYSYNEDFTTYCWEESVIGDNSRLDYDKLSLKINKVKSDITQRNYFIGNSPSYQSLTGYTADTISLSINTDYISDDDLRGMMFLSTYPFKGMDNFVKNLVDNPKIANVPLSYLAWIGAHILRHYSYRKTGFDIVKWWFVDKNNEFSLNQVGDINKYINLGSTPSYIGNLPAPFNNYDIFFNNEKINDVFINVFRYWVKEVKSYWTKIDDINSSNFVYTNSTTPFVSYTSNFWKTDNKTYFQIDESTLTNYVKVFVQKFTELNKNGFKKEINPQTPRKVTDNDPKLQLYKYNKNIYDKWIGGTLNGKPYSSCGGLDINSKSTIFSLFNFIDKDYNDISDKATINLNSLLILTNNTNVSFLDLISRIFRDNNFLLMSLPVFVDYKDINEVKNIFRPYTYIDKLNSSPAFVAMYNSGNSKSLDLKSGQYKNDSYDFVDNDTSTLPTSMTKDKKSIVAFRVGFGDENQSIFKNISINQEEFTETDESLRVLSEQVDRKGATQRAFKGTNLYNVYSLRSYNLNFDMMGNAMIQPLMYLQLDNIPMFHGAYSVINVSHDISPNKMNTRVRAVRKSKYSVPIVTDSTTFLPLDLNKNLNVPSEVIVVGAGDITDPVISNSTVVSYVNPVEDTINITSGIGLRNGRPHNGVDIGVPSGTEVKSSWSGIINIRENEKGYGLYTIIDHSNGQNIPFDDGYYYYTLYAHLKEITINDGEQLKLGQKFGFSGGGKNDPGRGNSSGPHLHYEIRRSLDRLKNPKFEFFDLKGTNILNPINFIKNNNSGVASNQNPDHGELSNIA